MKISLLQNNITWAAPVNNHKHIEQLLSKADVADLYVLPEMFSTGFCTKPENIAEPLPCKTVEWMCTTAKEKGCALAGSVAIFDGTNYFNRFYFITPNGIEAYYDKKHLFTYGGEHLHFTPGKNRVIVNYKGVRILLQTCYDLRFPVWSRNRGDYDMIIYVASWPTPRVNAWSALLRARAIENQCYVAGVNRVGTDPSCEYCGGTALIDPYGNTMAECKRNMEDNISGEIELSMLEQFRKTFPVQNDADPFEIKQN